MAGNDESDAAAGAAAVAAAVAAAGAEHTGRQGERWSSRRVGVPYLSNVESSTLCSPACGPKPVETCDVLDIIVTFLPLF